ncbi:sucrase-isomaltase, intestinal-like [Watersipora subatra]|uniref:sucrase-isomaltase, intestinal-like n=1 Tax=Watersipora subatra TaxID=2589382 RepID=UPI00355B8AC1
MKTKAVIGIAIGFVVVVVVGVGLHFGLAQQDEDDFPPIPPTARQGVRVDCLIDRLVKTEKECYDRQCAWDDSPGTEDADKCSLTVSPTRGYKVKSITKDKTGGIVVRLSYTGEVESLFSHRKDVIREVDVKVTPYSGDTVRIQFTDAQDSNRYQVPLTLGPGTSRLTNLYNYTIASVDKKFSLKISRVSDKTVVFDTAWADLIMEKQYLSLSVKLPSKNVYGLGENVHRHFKHQFAKAETWAMLARDQPPGQDPNQHSDNLYGVHPFYVCIENGSNAHGVFLLNSNPQDVTLTTGGLVTYRTIGGILDFFVFMGPTPENVVQQYTQLIGRPYMPPYWSLGFQLCRYGYKNTKDIQAAVNRTLDAGIPHDVQYADIDYMDGRKDFTVDPIHFHDMPAYFRKLQDDHMKIIIILDPAISIQANYPIYPEGKAEDVFIKWPTDDSSKICDKCEDDRHNMFGYVWPDNKTAFPDFFKNNTKVMWKRWIVHQYQELRFDGLWIDMNEPASFDTNKNEPWNWKDQRPGEPAWNLKCDMYNNWENPPYKTKACHIYPGELRNLSDKTICMAGLQGENNEYRHYDVHNLYGWSQTEPTLVALREALGNNKRGMVITRSTFAGSGRHAGHWLGDNSANWQHLRDSIIGMLEFNLFGIPYVGADICGFFGNTTASLCKRWMQLGAFYPFSRNHNGKGYIDQDPAVFTEDPLVASLSKSSVETRYRLLPYLYTLFYRANSHGDTVVRSLQFEWPTDPRTYDISEQFLWGSSLLFSPILYEDQTTVSAYLPEGKWYDYYTYKEATQTGKTSLDISVNESSEIPIHIRGGSILPTKESALTTFESRQTPFTLIVALDKDGKAEGELFWDDGETINTATTSCLVSFSAAEQFLNSTVQMSQCVADSAGDMSLMVNSIRIVGFSGNVTQVTVNSNPISKFKVEENSIMIGPNATSILIQDSFSIHWL